MRQDVHVTPGDNGKWKVKDESNEQASSVHETQEEAIKAARKKAQNNESEVVIHGKDGQIREKFSAGDN